jgi:hypothetical protein
MASRQGHSKQTEFVGNGRHYFTAGLAMQQRVWYSRTLL